jgi:hypothetical protein
MHAAVLGLTIGLLGVKVGWEVGPDRSVEYVIQLDADDLEQFRVERVIRSDVPSRMKNIRSYRIEYGMGLLPPRQDPLPKEEPTPRGSVGGAGCQPAATGRRGSAAIPWVYGRGAGLASAATPDFLMRPEDKKAARQKSSPSAQGAGAEDKSGKQGPGGPQQAKASPPWMPLAVTLAFCVSLGGNLYLAWLMWETRRRYRRLVQRHRKAAGTANDEGRIPNDKGMSNPE